MRVGTRLVRCARAREARGAGLEVRRRSWSPQGALGNVARNRTDLRVAPFAELEIDRPSEARHQPDPALAIALEANDFTHAARGTLDIGEHRERTARLDVEAELVDER